MAWEPFETSGGTRSSHLPRTKKKANSRSLARLETDRQRRTARNRCATRRTPATLRGSPRSSGQAGQAVGGRYIIQSQKRNAGLAQHAARLQGKEAVP